MGGKLYGNGGHGGNAVGVGTGGDGGDAVLFGDGGDGGNGTIFCRAATAARPGSCPGQKGLTGSCKGSINERFARTAELVTRSR